MSRDDLQNPMSLQKWLCCESFDFSSTNNITYSTARVPPGNQIITLHHYFTVIADYSFFVFRFFSRGNIVYPFVYYVLFDYLHALIIIYVGIQQTPLVYVYNTVPSRDKNGKKITTYYAYKREKKKYVTTRTRLHEHVYFIFFQLRKTSITSQIIIILRKECPRHPANNYNARVVCT